MERCLEIDPDYSAWGIVQLGKYSRKREYLPNARWLLMRRINEEYLTIR
jgi:hypothetical protein